MLRQATQATYAAAIRWAEANALPTRIRQPDGSLIELVGLDGTRPIYRRPHNRVAAQTTRTHVLPDLGLTGAGLALGLWDSGHPLATHQEFGDRIIRGDVSLFEDHATHVAGTLAASGVDPDARGMAFETNLHVYTWLDDTAEMAQEAIRNNLLVSNHSYGPLAGWEFADIEGQGPQWYWMGNLNLGEEVAFGHYGIEAELWDFLMLEHPFLLPVLSAGNHRGDAGPGASEPFRARDPLSNAWTTYTLAQRPLPRDGGNEGYDTLAGRAVAKNPLVVGSVPDFAGPEISPSSFSAYGPTDDGRIKPDLVANGETLFSPVAASEMAYGIRSGTSMAAPNVAGSLLLLQQLEQHLSEHFMPAATLKGLALHTATDLGLTGPDYQFGWGLLNAEAAATQVADQFRNQWALYEGVLADQQIQRLNAMLEASSPVKITLCWTDPHSNPTPDELNWRIPTLVNDLDLRLIHEDTGTAYFPYVLNPELPTQAASIGDNVLDPVEQIFLPDAPPGTYTIHISHKDVLEKIDSQPFSLLVSGLVDEIRLVTIADFSAQVSAAGVTFAWRTDREFRDGQFELVRDQAGHSPVPLTRISSTGSENAGAQYTFTDADPVPGPGTYRLLFVPAQGDVAEAATLDLNVPILRIDNLTAEADLERVRLTWNLPFAFEAGTLVFKRTSSNGTGGFDPTETVGQLSFEGPSRAVTSYTYEDPFVRSGSHWYLLMLGNERLATIQVTVPVPERLDLISNFPNPFSNQTDLILDIPASTIVTADVYDSLGRPVKNLVQSERLPGGRYLFTLDTTTWTPGLYLTRVITSEGTRILPMIRIE